MIILLTEKISAHYYHNIKHSLMYKIRVDALNGVT